MTEKYSRVNMNRLNPSDYRHMIEIGYGTLNDEQMRVLFALVNEPTAMRAAKKLKMRVPEMRAELYEIAAQLGMIRPERTTRTGRFYRKRLGAVAYQQILREIEMEDDEREIIEAAAKSFNQVIAAKSLDMTFAEFNARHTAIRNRYDF